MLEKDDIGRAPSQDSEYFEAMVDEKEVSVKNGDAGHFVSAQYGLDAGIKRYVLTINLNKADLQKGKSVNLQFQLYDFKIGLYRISNQGIDNTPQENRIILVSTGNGTENTYAPRFDKPPFEIEISKIKYHNYSEVPAVSGRLNGILYNTPDFRDSLVITKGSFSSRY